jgi:hypothetical protein
MRHQLDAFARHALVAWPDMDIRRPRDHPACIYLSSVEDAVRQGAVVIAREWEPIVATPQGDGDDAD